MDSMTLQAYAMCYQSLQLIAYTELELIYRLSFLPELPVIRQ